MLKDGTDGRESDFARTTLRGAFVTDALELAAEDADERPAPAAVETEGPPKTASSPESPPPLLDSLSVSASEVRRSIDTRFDGGGARLLSAEEEEEAKALAGEPFERNGLSKSSEGAERGIDAGEAAARSGPSPAAAWYESMRDERNECACASECVREWPWWG